MKNAKNELADDTLKKLEVLRLALHNSMDKESIEKNQWESSLSSLRTKIRSNTVTKRGKEARYNQKVVDSLIEVAQHNIEQHGRKVEERSAMLQKIEAYTERVKRAKSDFSIVESTNYLLGKIGERDRAYEFNPMKEIQDVRKAVFTIGGYRELL